MPLVLNRSLMYGSAGTPPVVDVDLPNYPESEIDSQVNISPDAWNGMAQMFRLYPQETYVLDSSKLAVCVKVLDGCVGASYRLGIVEELEDGTTTPVAASNEKTSVGNTGLCSTRLENIYDYASTVTLEAGKTYAVVLCISQYNPSGGPTLASKHISSYTPPIPSDHITNPQAFQSTDPLEKWLEIQAGNWMADEDVWCAVATIDGDERPI